MPEPEQLSSPPGPALTVGVLVAGGAALPGLLAQGLHDLRPYPTIMQIHVMCNCGSVHLKEHLCEEDCRQVENSKRLPPCALVQGGSNRECTSQGRYVLPSNTSPTENMVAQNMVAQNMVGPVPAARDMAPPHTVEGPVDVRIPGP